MMVNKGSIKEAKRLALYAGISRCSSKFVTNWGCKYAKLLRQSQLRLGDGLELELFSTYSDNKTKTRFYVYIDHHRKEIVVAFRCCCNFTNAYLCALGNLKNVRLGQDVEVKIHNGFLGCSRSLKVGYIPTIDLLANQMYPDYQIVLTGYSMGSSLAVLAALDLVDELNIYEGRLKVYTYGGPRFGNKALANYINQKTFTLARVVNADDIIPHLGPPLLGYKHHDHRILIDKLDREEYFENVAEKSSSFISKSSDSKSSRSSSSYFWSITDHYSVWGLCLTHKCE